MWVDKVRVGGREGGRKKGRRKSEGNTRNSRGLTKGVRYAGL